MLPDRRSAPLRHRLVRRRQQVLTHAPLAPPLARTAWQLAVRGGIGMVAGAAVAAGALAIDGAVGWSLPFDPERVQSLLVTVTGASLTIGVFALWMRSIVVGLVSGEFHARTLSTYLDDRFQRATAGWVVAAFTILVTVSLGSPPTGTGRVAPVATLLALLTTVAALLGILLAVRQATFRLDPSDLVHVLADRAFRVLEETWRLSDEELPDAPYEPARAIDTEHLGWVRRIDRDELVGRLPAGARAELLVVPGQFVAPGETLLTLDTRVDETTADALRAAIEVGRTRDPSSDLAFSIEELTDVARYAAGPGADVGTAREVLRYLEALLGRLLERRLPTGHARDGDRTLRARVQPTVAEYLEPTVRRIAGIATGDPVAAQLAVGTLQRLADHAAQVGDQETADLLRRAADASERGRHPAAFTDDEHGGA